MKGWTPGMDATLRSRWAQGCPPGAIAKALGAGFTKDMVTSRAHKLQLQAPGE